MSARILLVDDDALFREATAGALRHLRPDWQVSVAQNGLEALEALELGPYDVLVTDINMPMMDGLELIAELREQAPQLPIVAVTAESALWKTQAGEALVMCQKPIALPALARAIEEALAASVHGEVRGVTLQSYLQLLGQEKRTMALRLHLFAGHQSRDLPLELGLLFIQNGEVVDAELGAQTGLPAALRLVGSQPRRIEILAGSQIRKRTVSERLDVLLLESFRLQDEAIRDSASIEVGSLDLSAETTGSAESVGGQMKEDNVARILKGAGIIAASASLKGAPQPLVAHNWSRQAQERAEYFLHLAHALGRELGLDRFQELVARGQQRTLLLRDGARGQVGVELEASADEAAVSRDLRAEGL